MMKKPISIFLLSITSQAKRILLFLGFLKAEPLSVSTKESLAPFLEKLPHNPILKPIYDNHWESLAVFNPAAVYEDGKVHLVYRAVGGDYVSVWGYAASRNGTQIDKRYMKPINAPSGARSPSSWYYASGPGIGGYEDPRITKIDSMFYMTYTAFDGGPPRVALSSIKVEDFLQEKWNWGKPVLISPPGEVHKNWVIFPEKINGKYAILHSISPEILVDYVDSLDFDGETFIDSYHNGGYREEAWDNMVRGAGPPPIKTKDGWLILYHAMDRNDPNKYKIGAMLLDINDPAKVLYRSTEPVLEPDTAYENNGFKAGVVYTCGAVVVDGQLIVYYGGADTVVCAAVADLESFLQRIKKSQPVEPAFSYAK